MNSDFQFITDEQLRAIYADFATQQQLLLNLIAELKQQQEEFETDLQIRQSLSLYLWDVAVRYNELLQHMNDQPALGTALLALERTNYVGAN